MSIYFTNKKIFTDGQNYFQPIGSEASMNSLHQTETFSNGLSEPKGINPNIARAALTVENQGRSCNIRDRGPILSHSSSGISRKVNVFILYSRLFLENYASLMPDVLLIQWIY